jgi:hypothetical protein
MLGSSATVRTIIANTLCSRMGLYSLLIITCFLSVEGIELGNFPPLFNSENHSMLLQCVDAYNFDIDDDCENGTVEVICEIPSSPENTKSMPMTTSVSVYA